MLNLNFNPFPVIETERLFLRRITLSDTLDFFSFRSDKDVADALDKEPLQDIKSSEDYIITLEEDINSNKKIAWAITLKENGKLIGDIAFYYIDLVHHRAEIGYALLPDFQGVGIGNEAIKVALDYGFNLMKLHSVEAKINPINSKSENLLLKNGFVKEAHIKENFYFRGEYSDTAIYSLLKSNYRTSL